MSSKKTAAALQTSMEAELLRILNENNNLLRENNQVMKDIREMLRKVVINTS